MKTSLFASLIFFLAFSSSAKLAAPLITRYIHYVTKRVEIAAKSTSGSQSRHSLGPIGVDSGSLESFFIKGKQLSYMGYKVVRRFDPASKSSSATISKGGQELVTLNDGWGGKDSTMLGLFSLLGVKIKQLVILQDTGGAHCCSIYHIYELEPQFRLIFDDGKYGTDSIGYQLNAIDLEGNGKYELTQRVMTFDYFPFSHASSVFPIAVFAFDEKKRQYLPANARFAGYLLRDIRQDIRKVAEMREEMTVHAFTGKEQYLSAVLRVLLAYIYAGRETEGWAFYDREYQLDDREELKIDIRKKLSRDPIFESIY